jgi:hypothetical protein
MGAAGLNRRRREDREPMTAVGQWCATYAPGSWLVLCGPASVVVLEPPGEGWTPLVAELWQQVLASSSLIDLAARLARYGLDTMPSFGALFWTPEGMRSLVRGSIRIVDTATGRVVADGDGIQTWSEVGLEALRTVRIATDATARPETLQLPLVVGAVQASSVLLDARERARVHSPQLDQPYDGSEATGEPTEPTEPTEPMGSEVQPTELLPDPPRDVVASPPPGAGLDPEALENADTALVSVSLAPELGPAPHPPAPPAGPTVEATVCPHGHPNPPGTTRCRECGASLRESQPRTVAQPVLALLRGSDGAEAPVDRTVLVGRAPAQSVGTGARLLTVPSPSHDISRTHLEVAPDGWRILVTDLHSTNGTVLLPPGSQERRLLTPGEPVAVELGSVLELADGVSVLVDRAR